MTGEPWDEDSQLLDPLSLLESQRQQRWALRAMHDAKKLLEDLRNKEVTLKHEYERAKRRVMLGGTCPKVERGGYTVADRDIWVEDKVSAEKERYDLAQAATQAAKDHVDTLRSQSMTISSLSKLVQQIHGVAGVTR